MTDELKKAGTVLNAIVETAPDSIYGHQLMVVEEPKRFGFQGYSLMPLKKGETGRVYYRVSYEDYELTGGSLKFTEADP